MSRTCFLSSFAKIRSAVADVFQPIERSVQKHKYMYSKRNGIFSLRLKFCQNPFSAYREVENVLANKRLWRPSLLANRHEKHKHDKRNLILFLSSFVKIRSAVAEKSKTSYPIRDQEGNLC